MFKHKKSMSTFGAIKIRRKAAPNFNAMALLESETRFQLRAERGKKTERGLILLRKAME